MKCPISGCKIERESDHMMDHLGNDHTKDELAIASCQLTSKWDLAAKVIHVRRISR